ncbi:MAG: hypothetical protein ACE5OW_02180 [Candidatus Bathyarchaeia archaeon]
MNSWKQSRSFGGFIIHPIHGVINFSWVKAVPSYTYTPLMRGFKNLYENTGEDQWLEYLVEAKEFLLSIIDVNNLFKFSALEYAPGDGTLVHLSYPIIGLLEAYRVLRDEGILKVCRRVIESIISLRWSGRFYDGTWNQDLCLVEALAKYSLLSKSGRLWKKFGLPVAELSLGYAADLKTDEKIVKDAIVRGLYPPETSMAYPWYNAFMAGSYIQIFEYTRDERWLERAKRCLNFAFENSTEGGLIHSTRKINEQWIRVKTPQLIVPAFLLLINSKKISGYTNFRDVKKYENLLLKEQLSHGGFRNCKGYGIRDVIATTPFNVFAFEYLTMRARKSPELDDFVTYEQKMGKFQVREDKDNLGLSMAGVKILDVSKKKGTIKIFKLPQSEVSGKIHIYGSHPVRYCDIHVLIKEHYRAVDFGFVDTLGNCFLPRTKGKMLFWHPTCGFLDWSQSNKEFNVRVKEEETRRKLYYKVRSILYRTPFFSASSHILNRLLRYTTKTYYAYW